MIEFATLAFKGVGARKEPLARAGASRRANCTMSRRGLGQGRLDWRPEDELQRGRDPSITVVAPPRPVASATAPPPPESEWAPHRSMDEQELARLLLGKGENQWPSEHLATVCARIEEMTSHTAPKKLAQRRVYIQDWAEKVASGNTKAQAAAAAVVPETPRTTRGAGMASLTGGCTPSNPNSRPNTAGSGGPSYGPR